MARCLEELGHEVVVKGTNFAPMYATRSRRVKTDKRDARSLAEACRLGAYRPAHRTSDAKRHMRAQLAVRETLVRTRTRYIALVRREGLRGADGEAESFARRVAALALPGWLMAEVAPLLSLMLQLNEQIAFLNGVLERLAQKDEQVSRLCTVPQVGPVTACAFVSAVDEPARFRGPHQVEAYLGLVPGERSSGEKQHKGSITKTGNSRTRWLLIQAALSLLRVKSKRSADHTFREKGGPCSVASQEVWTWDATRQKRKQHWRGRRRAATGRSPKREWYSRSMRRAGCRWRSSPAGMG